MGVNGGAGNAISFSEIQTFYGGSNPISISEYYRGGSEVPTNAVAAQAETSGTSSQTVGDFAVTVTEVAGSLTTSSLSSVSFRRVTVTAQHSFVTMTITGGGQAIFSYHPSPGTGNSVQLLSTSLGGGGEPTSVTYTFRCPQFNSGDATASDSNTYAAGMEVIASGTNTGTAGFRAVEHDVDFTNNNSATLTTTSGSTGGAQTYTSGQTRKVKDNQSTNSYVLGYDAIGGNTNVPTSGTVNIDIFNAPGNPVA